MVKRLCFIIALFIIAFTSYSFMEKDGNFYISSSEEVELEIPRPANSGLCGLQIHNRTGDVIKFKWSIGGKYETVTLKKNQTLTIDLIRPTTQYDNLCIQNIGRLMVISVIAEYESL